MTSLRAAGAVLLAALVTLSLTGAPAAADTFGYTGLVTDPDGAPVANACFALHTSATEVAAEYCSDAQGRYTIPGPGDDSGYKIRMHADGFRTEWWYRAPDYLNADRVGLPAYDLIERDVTLGRGSGGVTGRITDENGAPSDATVRIYGEDSNYEAFAYTWDLGDGRYRIDNVPPGRYRISVYDNERGFQWVPGQETQDTATVFDVADGAPLVVDEQLLPLGRIEARVTDAVTGKPVPRPCLYVYGGRDEFVCGTDGVVRVTGVRPGSWETEVTGGASYFAADPKPTIDVRRGQVTTVAYALRPGAAFATMVRDAMTSAPVAGICVHLVQPKWGGQSAHMSQYCSGADGYLEAGPFEANELATWQLYAYQADNPYDPPARRYGDQWVTANGGSGDQRNALAVTLHAGKTTTLPAVRMDQPGTITGTVRNAAGAVVPGICAYPFAFHPGQGNIFGKNCTDAAGRYVLDDLGPYRWPVEFAPAANTGYAWQWSGNVADRFAATYTKVTAGRSATVDAKLVAGGVLAGKVTDPADPDAAGYVWTYNARTGDIASASYGYFDRGTGGAFTVKGHRTQDVYVQYWVNKDCWYGSPNANTVRIKAGATTTVAMNTTSTCGSPPAGVNRARSAPLGAHTGR
ncbi:carboxypeptidase-like regulatory domain-containing protein [Micromonospora robiginosa]|uniref:Carboxypeptidase-like regulatory domain-containing protein n=1 Tax=Micromonospora robiginosa TaxID=2749844 RepID=A0A7L6B7R0_9ACTN|nr:carboxypeptidase-like regulatory domain-containing protein [Micromonospora ferruginea]QLQ37934.1 carboxypeptidase-like regulatory domain-containing protein [Micromonospora ferruginea]